MKIVTHIELSEEELTHASTLLDTIRSFSDDVQTIICSGDAPLVAMPTPATFHSLISSLDSAPEAWTPVAQQLRAMFQEKGQALVTAGPDAEQLIVMEFLDAFSSIVFDPFLVSKGVSIAPYVFLFTHIPEPFQTKARDMLLKRILHFLTLKRPLDCIRAEFFAHAEAFSTLVQMEFVSATGALTTINTLLARPDNRCAAFTMLGKMVELCVDALVQKCDHASLRQLKMTLDSIHDPQFEYDISYINDNINWRMRMGE